MLSGIAIRYRSIQIDIDLRSHPPLSLSTAHTHTSTRQDNPESVKLVEHGSNQRQIKGENVKASELCLRFLGKRFVARFNQ